LISHKFAYFWTDTKKACFGESASNQQPPGKIGLSATKGEPLIIAGLTGGIASGKSTISEFLRDAGARIIDADEIARQVVKKGLPAYEEICTCFGRTILRADGEIDRQQLGTIIFNDPHQKARLDAIVHPRVFAQADREIATIEKDDPAAVVIMDIPLLFETGMQDDLAEVIVVFVPEALQLERLIKRDGIDQKAAISRIRSQIPIAQKRERATIVIDNSGSRSASRLRALEVYNQLKEKDKLTIDG
jgi:dephospho-CoA kinase